MRQIINISDELLKMNTIRRGLKRKEPEREEEYQAGLTQFQVRFLKIYLIVVS